jgi:hypothetical protein
LKFPAPTVATVLRSFRACLPGVVSPYTAGRFSLIIARRRRERPFDQHSQTVDAYWKAHFKIKATN